MKTNRVNSAWRNTLLAAFCTLLVAGCASSRGYKQADKTGDSINTVRNDIANVKTAVDSSMKALDTLAASASTDPRQPYEAFAKSVDKVEAAGTTAKKDADTMRERAKAYFDQWDAQLATVQSEDIKNLAQQRKAKLQETFDKIKDASQGAKDAYPPFLANLKDLRTALGTDLTPQGIEAAKDIFAKTKSAGTDLQQSLDKLIGEMNSVAAAITAAKVKPPAKESAPPPKQTSSTTNQPS
jgi:uncharacterized protein YoxC